MSGVAAADRSGEILAARWAIERLHRPRGADLVWLGYAKPEVMAFACLACGAAGFKQGVLRAEGRTLYLCGGCASHQVHPVPPPGPPQSAAAGLARRYAWECAPDLAGAAAVAARAVAGRAGGRLLDLECGLGFAVDIVAHLPGWSAAGVDPGPRAALGAEAFGAKLLTGGAEAVARLQADAGGFSVVLCEGALERSPDPCALLAAARAAASPDARWLLGADDAAALYAAPDAESVRRLMGPGRVLLPSRIGLERLLAKAGFEQVAVRAAAGRLRADRRAAADKAQAAAEPRLDAYLARRVAAPPPDASLRLGLLGHALTRAVERGDWAGGRAVAAQLAPALAASAEAARGAGAADSLEALLRAAPLCAPALLHHAGLLHLHGGGAMTQALLCFELGAVLARRACELAPPALRAVAEPQWAARFHAGLVRSRMGEAASARAAFESLAGETAEGAAPWAARARGELETLPAAAAIIPAAPQPQPRPRRKRAGA